MNIVDAYSFGRIVIDGKKYSSDVIIFPDRVHGDWHRGQSHVMTLRDISGVFDEKPEVLIVGTGASSQMKVLPEVQDELESRDILLIAQPTGEACEVYNQLSGSKPVIAALHLTC